jgi:cytidylate kinase
MEDDMTTETADHVIERLADHSLEWSRIEHQIAAALHHETPDDPPDHHMGPYVAVSRMSGAGGGSFARRLGEALRWPALDGEIVDLVAEIFELDAVMLHLLDEAKANWVRDVLGDLMPQQIVNRDTFVHHLGRVLRLVALHGNVVLVGRASQLFLPRQRGLAVRLVAPENDRISRVMARDGVGADEALDRIRDVDQRRAHFVKHYFGLDINDPTHYDLVLNRSTLDDDEMADIVLDLCRRRGWSS